MYISHYRFQHDAECPRIVQSSFNEYQATRSHPERPTKTRSTMDKPPVELTASRIQLAPLRTFHAENRRRLTLYPNQLLKIIGYNSEDGDTAATTGTSKLNTPRLTDGMGPCIGVAIGGEKHRRGRPTPGAKVRIFHVFPRNSTAGDEVRAYIQKLQRLGLSVRAAMHGGELGSQKSVEHARNFRALFSAMNVCLDFDETCERRTDNKAIGVIIQNNHSLKFITDFDQQ